MMFVVLVCQQMVRSRAGNGAHDKSYCNLSSNSDHCSLSDKVALGRVFLPAKDANKGQLFGGSFLRGNAERLNNRIGAMAYF